MSIKKVTFDSLPDINDPTAFEAWEETVLKIVDEFSLTATQYELINGRYSTIAKIFESPNDPDLNGVHFCPQGSFLTRTVIKPPSAGEIDVDAILWSPNPSRLSASGLYEAVYKELNARTRTESDVERKNRCSRVKYADESPSFHMDVTPAVNAFGNNDAEAKGKLRVPDLNAIEAGQAQGWKPSAPKLFAEWVNDSEKNFSISLRKSLNEQSRTFDSASGSSEPLPDKEVLDHFDPLRATIKLLKYHREKFFAERSDAEFKPISVVITTLAARAYRRISVRSRQAPMTPMQAIIEIIDALPGQFDSTPAQREWRLNNPVMEEENFAERWNDAKDGQRRVQAFTAWHEQIRMDVRLGLKGFSSKEEFTRTVSEAFGTRSTRPMLEGILGRAIATGGPVIGLSTAAAHAAAQPSAVERVFGIGREQPKQEAEPLRRLG